MITLTNDFHKTSVNVNAKEGDVLTYKQSRRILKKLCFQMYHKNNQNCKCGGIRGPQPHGAHLEFDNQGNEFLVFAELEE
jgi:hypothetical protein